MLGIPGVAVVTSALAVELAGWRGQFIHAIHAASMWILALALLLQLVALTVRTEAGHVCVRATGAIVGPAQHRERTPTRPPLIRLRDLNVG